MRTLKKALSLVLVLAMVLSLGVTAFAVEKATDFSDYNKVTNKEAVDVLAAIGVINGNTDGTFGPEGNFTRAQAATILSYMTLGTTVANALPASATKFNDVPATHWAAKYVQYCADAGMINGYGDGNFGPDAQLTSTQWALMLLGALGYKAANENIGGSGWEIAATRLAISAGVASAEELTGTFNRDMAAKMALNTLKATEVEYKTSGTSIIIGDTTVNTGASAASKVVNNATKETIKNDDYMQFAEDHFTKLEITSTTADDFGRPCVQWKLNNKTIGTYTSGSDLVVRYTAATKESVVKEDLKGWDLTKVENQNYVTNGTAATGTATDKNTDIDTVAEIAALTKNGKVVEIYGADNVVNKVIVVTPVLAKVSNVNTKTERISYTKVSDSTTYNTQEVGYGQFAKDEYVMVSVVGGTVKEAVAANVVTGTATAYTTGRSVTIDGQAYDLADSFSGTPTLNKEMKFYVDAYGYVVAAEDVSGVGQYVYVAKAVTNATDELGNAIPKAQVVFTDGTVEVVTLKEALTTGTGFYSYTVSNGKYELKKAETDTTASYSHKATETSIAKTDNKLGNHYFASDVKFVVVANAGQTNIKVGTYTGKQIITGTADIYYLTTKAVTGSAAGTIDTVIVVGGGVATSNTDLIFTTANGTSGMTVVNGENKDTLSVYVNGEKKTIPVANADELTLNGSAQFFTYTTDENGVYTLTSTSSNVASGTATVYGNYVSVAGSSVTDFTAADDIQVVDTRTDGDIDSLAGIQGATNDSGVAATVTVSVVYNATNSTVSMIYVTNVA